MIANPARPAPLVLVSWNAQEQPLDKVHVDAKPDFDLVVFDYSGTSTAGPGELRGLSCFVLSQRTECKGEIYHHLAQHLLATHRTPVYVGLIDDDVVISISAINYALHLARCAGLDSFSPALSHDSEYTHRWTLRHPNRMYREVDWVEVMMPFYVGSLFLAAAPHFADSVSSYGIDKYLMPALQQLTGHTRVAIIDVVMAHHARAVSSGQKTFRNGLTAKQEMQAMKTRSIELLKSGRPELLGSPWFRRIYEQRHSRTRWQQLIYGVGRPLRAWLERST